MATPYGRAADPWSGIGRSRCIAPKKTAVSPTETQTIVREFRVAVDAGPVLRAWNPLSHTEYWTDNDVTRPTAELIHGILKLL